MPRKPGTSAATRARRLLALLPHLRRGRTFSLAALAESLGAAPAELAADLTTLSMCGLPPYTADVMVELVVENGLVHVFSDPPALAEPARLAPAEARALLAAVEACGISADSPLVTKLAALAQPSFSAEELRHALIASASAGGAALQGVVAAAIDAGEVLDVDYVAGSGEASCRTVRPYALSPHRGSWYLSAYCESARADRTFRVDRIRDARPTGRFFDPPLAPRALPMPYEIDTLPVAEVRFAAAADGLNEREWPGATFAPAEDGTVLARVRYADARWLARRVASYLGQAEVVGPAEVREAVSRLAATMRAELADRQHG